MQYNVDIKVTIVLNNYFLGMVRQWQEKFLRRALLVSAMSVPNFVMLAEAYGARGFRIEKSKDLVATMKEAFATPGGVTKRIVIPKEEAVMPMIPPGGAMSEILLASKPVPFHQSRGGAGTCFAAESP